MSQTTHSLHDLQLSRQLEMWKERFRVFFKRWAYDEPGEASQSLVLKETHLPLLMRLTIIILSSATLLFLVWAGFTPVKELARTEGQVLPSGYTRIVQHLEGGLVREILVQEGDFVQKDQVLMRLDGAGLEEDYHEQQALVQNLSLQGERFQALLDGRQPDFSEMSADPSMVAEQKRMYETSRSAQLSERSVIDEQIGEKKKVLSRLGQTLEMARTNLGVAQENSRIYSDLNNKGLTSRTQYLKKEQELNSQQGQVNDLGGQIEEAKRSYNEYVQRREALVGQQRNTAYTELNRIKSELAQSEQNLKKRNDRVDRLEVRSPVMGYIKGMRINTLGSVIPAGQTLMEIVPVNEQLIVEARILPQQVGRVAVGQKVEVKVDSYDYVRFGTIEGTLQSMSAMSFTDEIRRQDYFKGRVQLSRNYVGNVPGQHVVMPGMTVDADILVGEKSVLGYLLKPIQVAVYNAMTEQ